MRETVLDKATLQDNAFKSARKSLIISILPKEASQYLQPTIPFSYVETLYIKPLSNDQIFLALVENLKRETKRNYSEAYSLLLSSQTLLNSRTDFHADRLMTIIPLSRVELEMESLDRIRSIVDSLGPVVAPPGSNATVYAYIQLQEIIHILTSWIVKNNIVSHTEGASQVLGVAEFWKTLTVGFIKEQSL